MPAGGEQSNTGQGSLGVGGHTVRLRSSKAGTGSSVSQLSGQSVSMSQGAFGKTITKALTGSAITGAQGQAVSAQPGSATALGNWISRSSMPGVVQAIRFDTNASVDDYKIENGVQVGRITRVPNDGIIGDGCLRIRAPAHYVDENTQAWAISLNDAWTTSTQGMGTNAFWIQFRMKVNSTRLINPKAPAGSSWKFAIIANYDPQNPEGAQSPSSNPTSIVLTDREYIGFPSSYKHSDGFTNGADWPLSFPPGVGSGDFNLLPGVTGSTDVLAGGSNTWGGFDRGSSVSPYQDRYCVFSDHDACPFFVPGVWYTFLVRVRVQSYGTGGVSGTAGNQFDYWYAPSGASQWTSLTRAREFTIGTREPQYSGGYNGLWLTNFETNNRRSSGAVNGSQTTTAGYAIGATTVNLIASGSGAWVVGDKFNFYQSADPNTFYTVTSGDTNISNGGSVSFTPGLTVALAAGQSHPFAIVYEQNGISTDADVLYDEIIVSMNEIPIPGGGWPVNPNVSLSNNQAQDVGEMEATTYSNALSSLSTGDYSCITYDPYRHRGVHLGGGHASTNYNALTEFNPYTLAFEEVYPPTHPNDLDRVNYDFSRGRWLAGTDSGPYPRPSARHTVDGIVVAQNGDVVILAYVEGNGGEGIAQGVNGWGQPLDPSVDNTHWTDAVVIPAAHFNHTTRTWSWGPIPTEIISPDWGSTALDPISGKIVIIANHRLALYDIGTKTATRYANYNGAQASQIRDEAGNALPSFLVINSCMTYCPDNDKFYFFPNHNDTVNLPGGVYELTLNRANPTASIMVRVNTTNNIPSTIWQPVSNTEKNMCWDSVNHLFVGGMRQGIVHAYNPATKTWSSKTPTGIDSTYTGWFMMQFYNPVDNYHMFICKNSKRKVIYRWGSG